MTDGIVMKRVRAYQNEVYANMAVELLKEHRIPSVIKGSETFADRMLVTDGVRIDVLVIDEDQLVLAESILRDAGLSGC